MITAAGFAYVGNAFNELPRFETASVDLIVTDPPYESLEKHRARGTTTRLKHSKASSNDWFPVIPNSAFPELFTQFRRVLKPGSHLYLFCDSETAFVVKPMGEAAGLTFHKPLIWDKITIGMGYHYRCTYEMVLFFSAPGGKRRLNDLGISDVLRAKRVRNGYPTEKPESLVRTLIEQSSHTGDLVLDPFCGGGTVPAAAKRTGRQYLALDIQESAVEYTRARIARTPNEFALDLEGKKNANTPTL